MRAVAALFRALPLLPSVFSLTLSQLTAELKHAELEIEHCWSPGENKAVFIVARKRVSETSP